MSQIFLKIILKWGKILYNVVLVSAIQQYKLAIIIHIPSLLRGFPVSSDGKESACNAGDSGLIPGLGRSPVEGNDNTPVFLPGEAHVQRSLVGSSPRDCKALDTTK